MPIDPMIAFLLGSQALLWVSWGFIVVSQFKAMKLQAALLKAQAQLSAVNIQATAATNLMSTSNWRDLPADGQQALRRALTQLLAEMEAANQVRH